MSTTVQPSYFEILSTTNVNDHVEQKNGLSYLSWAWAWSEFKKRYPFSYFEVLETENGVNYFTDGRTCWVKTRVTLIDGDTHHVQEESLPIMDFKNKSIPAEAVTSMDVNKAIKRCLVKNLAYFGLGLYIYAGEDLPQDSAAVTSLKMKIEAELQRVTKGMTTEQKVELSSRVVKPICGGSYRNVDDIAKLSALLDELKKL